MRVLFLTQILPFPLTSGAKVRAYYMLRYLSQQHQVTLVSFVRDDDTQEDIAHLLSYCHQVHTVSIRRTKVHDGKALLNSLLWRKPAVIIRDRVTEMLNLLKELVSTHQFDVVHADQTSMAEYALFAQDQADVRPRIILDEHNALYNVVSRQAEFEQGFRRRLWRREAELLRSHERELCKSFDQIITVSEEDRSLLLNLFLGKERTTLEQKITSIPICIEPGQESRSGIRNQNPQIIHLGTMFWPPNVEAVLWFSHKVLPLVARQVPEVHFVVAGKDPPAKVRELSDYMFDGISRVSVIGYVREPAELLSESHVFVVPIQAGGGMRVKILDAWAWGIPIVSTTIGAEGILIETEKNILIADEPDQFADMVARVLKDAQLSEHLIRNGRRWVELHYDWRSTYRKVEDVYTRLDVLE